MLFYFSIFSLLSGVASRIQRIGSAVVSASLVALCILIIVLSLVGEGSSRIIVGI